MFDFLKEIIEVIFDGTKTTLKKSDYVNLAIIFILALIVTWFIMPIVKVIGYLVTVPLIMGIILLIEKKIASKLKK